MVLPGFAQHDKDRSCHAERRGWPPPCNTTNEAAHSSRFSTNGHHECRRHRSGSYLHERPTPREYLWLLEISHKPSL